jgi:hypothetical protein
MKFPVSQISTEIFSGHTFRERIVDDPNGDCHVIQISNLDSNYTKIEKNPHKIKSSSISEKQFLKKGDVLFCAKGNNNFAFVFDKDYCAVAVSLFFVIRPDQEKVSPQYLAWFINQSATQSTLDSRKEGTSVTNISKKSLEDLEIKVPSLLTQNKLVNLYRLWQVEKSKTIEMIMQKEVYFNNLVLTEIEREHEVEPFTDEYGDWIGYETLSNYYIADMRFKESVYVKGKSEPVKQLYGIIVDITTYNRTVDMGGGSTRGYNAVKDWNVVEFKNLRKWNEGPNTKEKKDEILNVIPHSLIESITMVDRQGNAVKQ